VIFHGLKFGAGQWECCILVVIKTSILRLLPIVLLGLLFVGCGDYSLDKLPPDRLHFGNRGGFTGEIREYILLVGNGKILFQDPISKELSKVGKLDRRQLADIKAQLLNLDFSQAGAAPGNYNSVLTYHSAGQEQSLQWNGPNGAADQAMQTLFESLMTSVKQLRAAKNG